MSQHLPRRQRRAPAILLPLNRRLHFHQYVAAALLGCLDDVTLQLVLLRFARLDDAASRLQRHKDGRAELGQFLDEELCPVPFGQRGGHLQTKGQFPIGCLGRANLQHHAAALDAGDDGGILVAIAVEQVNGVAGAEAADAGKVVGLRSVQFDRSGREGQLR